MTEGGLSETRSKRQNYVYIHTYVVVVCMYVKYRIWKNENAELFLQLQPVPNQWGEHT
jgi:hypothetical protein